MVLPELTLPHVTKPNPILSRASGTAESGYPREIPLEHYHCRNPNNPRSRCYTNRRDVSAISVPAHSPCDIAILGDARKTACPQVDPVLVKGELNDVPITSRLLDIDSLLGELKGRSSLAEPAAAQGQGGRGGVKRIVKRTKVRRRELGAQVGMVNTDFNQM